jgi:hypothetical protein
VPRSRNNENPQMAINIASAQEPRMRKSNHKALCAFNCVESADRHSMTDDNSLDRIAPFLESRTVDEPQRSTGYDWITAALTDIRAFRALTSPAPPHSGMPLIAEMSRAASQTIKAELAAQLQ